MASFCRQCSIELFGRDFGNFAERVPEGEVLVSLYKGCGTTYR